MELVYFILGALLTIASYGVVLLRKTDRSHSMLLKSQQQLLEKMVDFRLEINNRVEFSLEEIYRIDKYINSVKENMKTNSYKSVLDVNKKINILESSLKVIDDKLDNQVKTLIYLNIHNFHHLNKKVHYYTYHMSLLNFFRIFQN